MTRKRSVRLVLCAVALASGIGWAAPQPASADQWCASATASPLPSPAPEKVRQTLCVSAL
jgi:hypothetical protein